MKREAERQTETRRVRKKYPNLQYSYSGRITQKGKSKVPDKKKLTPKQQKFIQEYIKLGNATQAYIAAGYVCNYKTATVKSSLLVAKDSVREEITKIRNEEFKKNVATSEEVMDFFSRVMRGEVKDQFGLETSVADRIKAGQELAKRTIDIDNRRAGLGDNTIEIKLDWDRPVLPESAVEFTVIDSAPLELQELTAKE